MSSLKSIRRSLRKQLTTVRLVSSIWDGIVQRIPRFMSAVRPRPHSSPRTQRDLLGRAMGMGRMAVQAGEGTRGQTGECPRKGSCQRQCSTPLKKMRSSHFEHSLRIQILFSEGQMDFQRTCWMRDALNHRAVHCFKLCKPFLCDLISMGIIYR